MSGTMSGQGKVLRWKNAIRVGVSSGLRAAHQTLHQEKSSTLLISRPLPDGFLDSLRIDPSGLITLSGWMNADFDVQKAPAILLDGERIPFLRHFAVRRPDVRSGHKRSLAQTGLELNYLVPEALAGRHFQTLLVQLPVGEELKFDVDIQFLNPDYRILLNTSQVLHRDHIYGSGLPNKVVHPHVVELAKNLKGPVLDFGCGRGAMLEELREHGIEAYGLEMRRDVIEQSISTELAARITLYDGKFPVPFPDNRFESVICSEVLEHIPDYQTAMSEIARISSANLLLTVPNASAIPLGHRHGSVPWHLMEATHVNFFTQESLGELLRPYFSKIEFGRIGRASFNDTEYYVGLAAFCRK
jgi:SAM-dependent methyltransferase